MYTKLVSHDYKYDSSWEAQVAYWEAYRRTELIVGEEGK
jgi:hypothetical protein